EDSGCRCFRSAAGRFLDGQGCRESQDGGRRSSPLSAQVVRRETKGRFSMSDVRRVLVMACALVLGLALISESQAGPFGRFGRNSGCNSGGCSTSGNSGCNISAAPPEQASAADLARQLIDQSASAKPAVSPQAEKQLATKVEPLVLDRKASLDFCYRART